MKSIAITKHSPKPSDASASAIAILKAEQRVHDEAAIGLMREAQKHLRAATRIDRVIGKLTCSEARAA